MYKDPIVNEVRKTRERLAEKHNFDVGAIFKDLRMRQAKLGKRLVHRERQKIAERAVTSDRNSAALHPGR